MMEAWQQNPPPWRAFEGADPSLLGANQGAEEAWLTQQWWPFWEALSPAQRDDYLEFWQADAVWRDALTLAVDEREDFDVEADARASERYRREQAISTPEPSWIKRLLKKIKRR